MSKEEWEALMEETGWLPIRDIFGNIVEWSLRRGQRVVKITRQLAEPYRNWGKPRRNFRKA